MKVQLFKGLSGCKEATGVGVVIDVFRATTTLCCLLYSKPRELYIAQSISSATSLTKAPDTVLFSEIDCPLKTYDNSPLAALTAPVATKSAVLLSKNGTVAIHALRHCERVFAGAFVNIDAIVDYLQLLKPSVISLIATGIIGKNEEALEDNLCAEMIHARLLERVYDEHVLRKLLRKGIVDRRSDSESPQGLMVEADLVISCGIGIVNVIPEIDYTGTTLRVFEP